MELEKLKKVIAEVLNVDPEEITPESTFIDDMGQDMRVEEIPAEMAEKITTVEEAVELIKGALN